MVVLPLLWLASYSAYRVLFDLLVNFADHLILVCGNIHRALSDNLVNITVYLILLSFWGAALVVLCIEGLGLDLHALPDCLVTVFDQVATYPAGASGEGTSRCFSGTRTMSTDSLDSMETMDTVTTSSETPGAFTSSPKFNFGSGVASGTSGIAGNDFMVYLEKDVLSVLKALHDKCTHHGLNIGDYISQEDAHLLDRINHE